MGTLLNLLLYLCTLYTRYYHVRHVTFPCIEKNYYNNYFCYHL